MNELEKIGIIIFAVLFVLVLIAGRLGAAEKASGVKLAPKWLERFVEVFRRAVEDCLR